MAYCSQADLSERFGETELAQLTDPAGVSPQAGEIAKACDEATSLVDSYVQTRYDVPLVSVPTIVRKWACDIARKFLWKDRASADSVVTKNYEDAVASLKDVSRGYVGLLGATGEVPAASDFSIAVVAVPQVFTPGLLSAAPGGPYDGAYWRDMLP